MKPKYFQVPLYKSTGMPTVKKIEIEGADGMMHEAYEFEGYANTKDKDRSYDVVKPEAFRKAIDMYMNNPIVLLQHDMDKPIGRITEATIDDNGLYVKGIVTVDIDNVFKALCTGILRAMSIGYRVRRDQIETIEEETEDGVGLTNYVKELELYEISLVSVPANPTSLLKSFRESQFSVINEDDYSKYFNMNYQFNHTLVKSIKETLEEIKQIEQEQIEEDNKEPVIEDKVEEVLEKIEKQTIEVKQKQLTLTDIKLDDIVEYRTYREWTRYQDGDEEIVVEINPESSQPAFIGKIVNITTEGTVMNYSIAIQATAENPVITIHQHMEINGVLVPTTNYYAAYFSKFIFEKIYGEEEKKVDNTKSYLETKEFEEERDSVFKSYNEAVNMSYSELMNWSKTECSRKASLSRKPIERNLALLSKDKEDWTEKDLTEANKTIAFVARMKEVDNGENVSEDCPYSKKYISLKNWAYDMNKTKSNQKYEHKSEKNIGNDIIQKKLDDEAHTKAVVNRIDIAETIIKSVQEKIIGYETKIKGLEDSQKELTDSIISIVEHVEKAVKLAQITDEKVSKIELKRGYTYEANTQPESEQTSKLTSIIKKLKGVN